MKYWKKLWWLLFYSHVTGSCTALCLMLMIIAIISKKLWIVVLLQKNINKQKKYFGW